MQSDSPTRVYEFRTRFHAPLPFVYAWCTDYSPEDPQLERDAFQRRIISKTRRRAVYEDLYDQPDGWMWSHMEVDFRPPNRWHAEALGSHRTWSIDYELSDLGDGSTELHFVGSRRATSLGRNPPKAEMERELLQMWKNLTRALEREYQGTRKDAGKRRR